MVATVAAPPRQRLIPELLVVHAEELSYLWGRRCRSIASASLTWRNLTELNERVEAHTQGLLVAGDALAETLASWLAGKERDETFTGAYPLLRAGQVRSAHAVVTAFREAKSDRLAGIRDALCLASIEHTERPMCEIVAQGDDEHAVAAACVLANHRRLDAAAPRLSGLIANADPTVAQLAWRVATQLDTPDNGIARPFEQAVRGEHAGLCDAALGAAVWRGESWAPTVARRLAEAGNAVGQRWLAAVGDASAAQVIGQMLSDEKLRPTRLHLASRLGHPSMIEALLPHLAAPDPATAAAAGEAFTRITGIDLLGERKTVAVADDASDFDREFADEVWVPDAALARQHWERNSATWGQGARMCRGCEISSTLPKEAQQRIDLEAFWDFGARAALAGQRVFAPPTVV